MLETLTAQEARVRFGDLHLKEKLAQAKNDIDNGRTVDGPAFFDDLLAGKYD